MLCSHIPLCEPWQDNSFSKNGYQNKTRFKWEELDKLVSFVFPRIGFVGDLHLLLLAY